METQPLTKIEKRKTNGAPLAPVVPPIAAINHLVIQIPPKEIRFSPFNRTGAREPDPELIEDVKRRGILEPILVRDVDGHWELIFGERRVRAAIAAKLELVPAFKADMTDAEVIETQIAENVRRRGLHPLEEAEAFATLRDRFGHDAETIAAKCGKSRSYVFQRVKLLELAPKVRDAFLKNEINASVALEIARIANESVQLEAFKEVGKSTYDGEPVSARAAHNIITGRYMLKLADAPFDTASATLTKAGSCAACPKRTGAQPELFADVKSPDVCTDPKCFAEKKDAGWKARVAEAKAKNQPVIPTEKAFPNGEYSGLANEYIDLERENFSDPKTRKWRQLLQGEMPEIAITRDRNGEIHEIVRASAARAALVKIGHAFAKPEPRPKPKSKPASSAAPAASLIDDRVEELATRMTIEAVVAKAEAKEPNAEWWRKAIDIFQSCSYSDTFALLERRCVDAERTQGHRAFQKLTGSLNAAKLRGLFVELLCNPGDGMTGELEDFAKFYGVDAKAIEKRARASIEKATTVDAVDTKGMPERDRKAIARATKKKGKRS